MTSGILTLSAAFAMKPFFFSKYLAAGSKLLFISSASLARSSELSQLIYEDELRVLYFGGNYGAEENVLCFFDGFDCFPSKRFEKSVEEGELVIVKSEMREKLIDSLFLAV